MLRAGIFGQDDKVDIAAGVVATGRVNYFIGLTEQFPSGYPCPVAGATIDDSADTQEL